VTTRIAMWSGPRNISTAMMRAWENRPDTSVVDEPFYACYLNSTGANHPMSSAVIKSQSSDWHEVAKNLSSDHCESEVFYQKHMTHHMLPDVDLSWVKTLKHCFLIRDPAHVVNSYVQKRDTVSAEDIGIIRQLALYEEIGAITGQSIPVIDARKTLEQPKITLQKLCEIFSVSFTEKMLQWPPGRRDSDGIWASHWYGAVEKSTGFSHYREPDLVLSVDQLKVAEESRDAYEQLFSRSLN
jgi:hypothetical protein